MPRAKVYPRLEDANGNSWLILLDAPTLDLINLPDEADDEMIKIISEMLDKMTGITAEWWHIETGVQLRFMEENGNYKWCIADNRGNTMKFSWMVAKARKYHQKIVDRVNDTIGVLSEGRAPQSG